MCNQAPIIRVSVPENDEPVFVIAQSLIKQTNGTTVNGPLATGAKIRVRGPDLETVADFTGQAATSETNVTGFLITVPANFSTARRGAVFPNSLLIRSFANGSDVHTPLELWIS